MKPTTIPPEGVDLLDADVLVLGGGPAGAWAAWSAARHGARVVLADKGYLGTSGATAPGGTNLLYVPPDPVLRRQAVERRLAGGGQLAEARQVHRVLDGVYESLALVERWGYPFVRNEHGVPLRNHLQGPEYMRLMRRVVRRAGARVLDQSPALGLLTDQDGVGGAFGVDRLTGREWEVRSRAVVLATGGCAFLSKGLGCNVLTGDGLLFGAEAGADLSGMEFSRAYGTSAAFGTVTRNRLLSFATVRAADGRVLDTGRGRLRQDALARALLEGPVHAVLDQAATPRMRDLLRHSHAVFFLPYDRAGIDPFTQPFPLTLRFEGTVRGTGGLRIVGDGCETTVPGLYAAGDAASRERTHGGQSGGGAYNAAWAICSGRWSGAAAAAHAASAPHGARRLSRGGALPPAPVRPPADLPNLVGAVQRETLPLRVSYFRSVATLGPSLGRLEELWRSLHARPSPAGVPAGASAGGSEAAPAGVRARVRTRELEAMVAVGRWMHTAALARTETRAMHRLAEFPHLDRQQEHRLLLSGLDHIDVRPERVRGRMDGPAGHTAGRNLREDYVGKAS